MKTIATVAAICTIGGTDSRAQVPPAHARPNIVWIVAEDLSPDLGAYGDK